jgi:hypothetical protein
LEAGHTASPNGLTEALTSIMNAEKVQLSVTAKTGSHEGTKHKNREDKFVLCGQQHMLRENKSERNG